MQIKTLPQFEKFLKTRIPSRDALFAGDIGLRRAKYFMRLLGDPQDKMKVIHIAGTSGKGSTAYLTSHLLQSQGFSVGLSISPHIFDVRERMQIDNKLPGEKLVLKYFNEILPVIHRMESCKYGSPTYFEILVGLAYHIFAKEKLDYAVIETGLGGRLDGTNTVTRKDKLCLLTRIGLDHTEILGNSLAKITSEKAGIIQKQNTTISNQSSTTCNRIINTKCQEKNATFHSTKPRKNYQLISSTQKETTFDFSFGQNEFKKIRLGLIGSHQVENCSLALACLSFLSKRDKFTIDEKKMRSALKQISIAGRMEIRKNGKRFLIVDGAHNPQKMSAFIDSLESIFPNQKFDFILAFKKGKDFKRILNKILPVANRILLTNFSLSNQDNHSSSVANEDIAAYFKKEKFENFSVIPNDKNEIVSVIKRSENNVVLTGSLYLIGSVYPYFRK